MMIIGSYFSVSVMASLIELLSAPRSWMAFTAVYRPNTTLTCWFTTGLTTWLTAVSSSPNFA